MYPVGTMDVYTKFYANPSNNWLDCRPLSHTATMAKNSIHMVVDMFTLWPECVAAVLQDKQLQVFTA